MSARAPRRVFATPFVVTIAAAGCFVDRPPVQTQPMPPPPSQEPVYPTNPPPPGADPNAYPQQPGGPYTGPYQGQPAQGPYQPPPNVVANPPRTQAQDRRWTITRSINQCSAHAEFTCAPSTQPGVPPPPCNPPAPILVGCPADLGDRQSVTIYQRAGESDCYVLPAPMQCPAGAMCNPPPPQRATCPQ